ncbi:MAG: ATP-binding protein [Oscillospiraceae bacterium]|nr:ATP-binding protein [Oscillospiraceae bacterium]
MLCQFIFKNYKSYRDETILDMQAVSNQGFEHSLLPDGNKQELLPVAAIYGPNAGGKSNVLDALKCLHSLVVFPILLFRGQTTVQAVNCVPFLFDEKTPEEPTEFEVFFIPDAEFEYRYQITVQNGKIVEENLYRRKLAPNSRISTLFERSDGEIKLGASIRKQSINTEVNEQMPYLSFLAINYKIEPINIATKWFEMCIIKNYANPYEEMKLVMRADEASKQQLLDLLMDVGITISGIQFENDDDHVDILFEHTVNNRTYQLHLAEESDGTQKLFNVLPLVIIALTEGRLLVLDELDAKLHPKLLRFLIMLFKNPEINQHKAQLIFTSHDISTMKSSVFRTDEIWFAYKKDDEASDLYSLYELRDENGNRIGPNTAYDKQYLEGRYGADPYFRNMMEWR